MCNVVGKRIKYHISTFHSVNLSVTLRIANDFVQMFCCHQILQYLGIEQLTIELLLTILPLTGAKLFCSKTTPFTDAVRVTVLASYRYFWGHFQMWCRRYIKHPSNRIAIYHTWLQGWIPKCPNQFLRKL